MEVGTRCDRIGTAFASNISRVTLLDCVCASGESVLPFWIFKSDSKPPRMCENESGSMLNESILSVLPGGGGWGQWKLRSFEKINWRY